MNKDTFCIIAMILCCFLLSAYHITGQNTFSRIIERENTEFLAQGIIETHDHGLLIMGRVIFREDYVIKNKNLPWLIKLNAEGDTEFEVISGKDGILYSSIVLPDSSFISGGCNRHSGYYKGYINKVSNHGELLWEKMLFENESTSSVECLDINNDGRLYGVAVTESNQKLMLFEIDPEGVIINQKIISPQSVVTSAIIKLTAGNNLLLTYTSTNPNKNDNVIVMKFDQDLNTVWSHNEYKWNGYCRSITELENHEYLLCGRLADGPLNDYGAVVYKIDEEGNLMWHKSMFESKIATAALVLKDGNYFISRYLNNNDKAMVMLNQNGIIDSGIRVGNINNNVGIFKMIKYGNENLTVLYNNSIDYSVHIHVLKLGELITSVGNNQHIVDKFELYQNYPNPFNPTTKIKYSIPLLGGVSPARPKQSEGGSGLKITLKVYDLLGREITTLVNEHKQPGIYEVEFVSRSADSILPSGVYLCRLQAGSYSFTRKMIYLK